jgi:hypothetical protein
MRNGIDIQPRHAARIVCTLALAGLVYAEAGTWPLEVAALMIPVSLLLG